MALTLYRVGEPSIGEAYINRWTWSRSTGGIGTGVYAFRTREAAEDNIAMPHNDGPLYELEDALENPIQPPTMEATRELNKLSRKVDLISNLADQGKVDLEEVKDDPVLHPVALSTGFGRDSHLGNGDPLNRHAFNVLLKTPELREKYGMDDKQFTADLIEAAQEARDRCQGVGDKTCVQPINQLLWPDYDGVAPHSGAGGDTGQFGCVIFKEKIDQCVGPTESFEEIAVSQLNRCFTAP